MEIDPPSEAPPSLTGDRLPPSRFMRQLIIVTMGLFLVLMVIYILREFAPILKPLMVSLFIGYAILPVHRWLVVHGVRPMMAYVVILVMILAGVLLFGRLAYSSLEELAYRMPGYEDKVDDLLETCRAYLPESARGDERWSTRSLLSLELTGDRIKEILQDLLGNFLGFASAVGVVAVYLLFLAMEKASIPRRVREAFSPARASNILAVIDSVNQGIGEYLAVKTLISFIGGTLTTLVLWLFGVDFYVMWGILAFLLNYIPYVGTLVAVSLPIMLSLVQFDSLWPAISITVLLVLIHQGLALFEPRIAGSRLGVSPFLILLALAFWGYIWGITGMILAVPMLVTIKIVLENIPETRPIARLISHV